MLAKIGKGILIFIVFISGFFLGNFCYGKYKTFLLIADCDVIDTALYNYSVLMKMNNNENFYPKTLEELGFLKNYDDFFANQIDLTKFDYTVTRKGTEIHYILGVHLPDGNYYVSPNSHR